MKQNVALVICGSGKLGASICKQLASEGMFVAVNYHSNKESADKVVNQIISNGGKARAFKGDTKNSQNIEKLILEISTTLGPVDVFVSNSDIEFPLQPFKTIKWDESSLKVNSKLTRVFDVTKKLMASMKIGSFGKMNHISHKSAEHSFLQLQLVGLLKES